MKEVVNLDLILNDKVTDIEVREQKELLLVEGNCIECGDQPSIVHCEQCDDDYCQVCFAHQHRKGNRTSHTVVKKAANEEALSPNPALKIADTKEDLSISAQEFLEKLPVIHTKQDYIEKAKFIPLRLTFDERKFLKLLEAALSVSSYTDKIDILTYSSKTTRIIQQIKELLGILAGLVLAADYKAGQKLFEDKEFKDNAEFFQMVFELGRRHKIMNPEKMRDGYGKLIYMLQDSQIEQVSELLQFKCVKPIITVHSVLEEYGKLGLLQDELLILATQEIIDDGRKRKDIQYDIKRKEKAIEILSKKYSDRHIEAETIRQCLYSIGDNNAFLRVNRDPCIIMIEYLKKYFDPEKEEKGFSLGISAGRNGARLSHGHKKQFQYVIQSLTLWKEVLNEMFKVWTLAETDLLKEDNYYRLRDTGQGLNRVQAAPLVSRIMHSILHKAQQQVGSWVGSSVIHLGDHNVPNALVFIDKYTQIYRILLPIVITLSKLETLKSEPLQQLIKIQFQTVEIAKKSILADFFRHGFDGSGADNFFDAGSCIDGRLTSAWNWCSLIEKKSYFGLFLLTGFVGFDGQF